MGSKSRIAKFIVPILQEYIDNRNASLYVEPFVGGCNIIDKINCKERVGSDINEYLIALLKHIQVGGRLPEHITRKEYSNVRADKNKYESWYVGCVGFLASFNGRWFDGGYSGIVNTKIGTVRNYYDEAKRNLLKQSDSIKDITFYSCDYRDTNVKNAVIYCDPPYQDTKQYTTLFDSEVFWETMRIWAKDNIVIISELNAPKDFECIWAADVGRTIKPNDSKKVIEKLFVLKE